MDSDFPSLPKRRHTKSERETVKMVQEDFSAAKFARQNNCYWDTSSGASIESFGEGTGGNWMDRWDLQEKIASMHFEKPSQDDYESNVKSPMSAGRIESTMEKLKKVNLRFNVRPEDADSPEDVRRARIVQALINNLFDKKNFKQRLNTFWKDTLVHGTGFLQIYYLRKARSVDIPITDTKLMTPEEKKIYKDGGIAYRKSTQYDYDDIAIEPVKIQELYVDPSARYLHGESYEAQWVIRRMLPSLEQFKSMFEGDDLARNVSKVRPIGSYASEQVEFFQPPTDVYDKNIVELLHYYNKRQDRYIVIANDVVIKDTPLPYIHKQLPFVMARAFEVPHQFYHAGIPDRLLAIQTEEENLKNTIYDRLHITTNPMFKIRRNIYGEVSKALEEGSTGLLAPVNQPDDITVQDYPTTSFDTFRAIENLSRDAVLATQIDPIQMGITQRYVSATTSMMTKEQMDTFIYSLTDNWMEAHTTAAYQIISLIKQFYTIPKVIDKLGETETIPRKVRLQGIEVNEKTFEIIHKKSDEYTFIEIKDEYFEIDGDWDVTVAPESMETMSRAVEMQKSQANLAQLAPFMVDPSDNARMRMHPNPWVDGPGFIRWYCETNDVPLDLIVSAREDDDTTMRRAEDQGKRIMKGEDVPGIPGESDAHKRVHVAQLAAQNKKWKGLEKEIGAMGPLAQMYPEMVPQTKELREAQMLAQIISMHLEVDDMPVSETEKTAIEQSQPVQPSVPMPPGLTPQGSSQPPTPAGGNQQAGMMGEPTQGGPGGQTGRPPLFEQQTGAA